MKSDLLERLIDDRREKRAAVLATNLTTGEQTLLHPLEEAFDFGDPVVRDAALDALRSDRSGSVEGAEGRFFLHVHNTPVRLVVVGAVHIAQPLTVMAGHAGFEVSLVDPREAFNTESRFPGTRRLLAWPADALGELDLDHRTAVVTLTHDPKLDDPALDAALRSPAFYIGALGSRKTHARRLERLAEAGFDEHDRDRVHGPIGLDIGARTPGEIATAILAQVVEKLRERPR